MDKPITDSARPLLSLENFTLDSVGMEGAPRYRRTYAALRQAILTDEDATQKSLPIEQSIATHFAVSKITVRQALNLLEQDGYIIKVHSKPAQIVRREPEPERQRRLGSLTDLLNVGDRKSAAITYTKVHDEEAAAIFGLPPTAHVFRLKLKQYKRSRQLAYTEVFLRPDIGGLFTMSDFGSHMIAAHRLPFKVVEEKIGLPTKSIKVTLGAEMEKSKNPRIPSAAGQALVRMDLVFSNARGPFQITRNWYDGRLYQVSYDLTV